ncbi:hypothetical protein [Pseudomonas putida]|nr:hypothetical protein [Pseudomonas putida]
MDTVHPRRVITHFSGQRAKQMANALLVLHVYIEVTNTSGQ